jgi:hypothetical protein
VTIGRFVTLVVIAILLAGILSDPYTYARDGSDAIRTAPVWQLGFAILDISMLLAIAALVIRSKTGRAFALTAVETVYYLAGNAVLYLRDGSARFVHGFGAESNLNEHVVVVVLRLSLLVYLWVMLSRRLVNESARRAA